MVFLEHALQTALCSSRNVPHCHQVTKKKTLGHKTFDNDVLGEWMHIIWQQCTECRWFDSKSRVRVDQGWQGHWGSPTRAQHPVTQGKFSDRQPATPSATVTQSARPGQDISQMPCQARIFVKCQAVPGHLSGSRFKFFFLLQWKWIHSLAYSCLWIHIWHRLRTNVFGTAMKQSGRWGLIYSQWSISAFLTDLKRFQTPHSLFWDFRANKSFPTSWSGGRLEVWVQVWAPAGHPEITPEGYSRRQSKVLTAKSIAKLLEQRSGTAWAGWPGEVKHREFLSQWQSLRDTAATGLLEENMLPLLQYWLSSRVKKGF